MILIATLTSLTASASPITLGMVSLTDMKDRDVVNLPACKFSPNQRVGQIKLKVFKHAAEIDHLRVQFHNGQSQRLHVRDYFYPGSSSRWMDLNGRKRCIKKIVVVGDSETRGFRPFKQAKVLFLGK